MIGNDMVIINYYLFVFKFQGAYLVELLLRFFLCMISTNSKLWSISGTLASLGNNLSVITFLIFLSLTCHECLVYVLKFWSTLLLSGNTSQLIDSRAICNRP